MKRKLLIVLLAIGFITLLFLWVFVITLPAISQRFDFSNTGQLGDTIGGLTAPLIGLLGAILVFVSFEEQRKANKIQIESLKAERWYTLQINSINHYKNLLLNFELTIPTDDNIYSSNNVTFKGFYAFVHLGVLKLLIDSGEAKVNSKHIYESARLYFQFIFTELKQLNHSIKIRKDKYPEEFKQLAEVMVIFKNINMSVLEKNFIEKLSEEDQLKRLYSDFSKGVDELHNYIKDQK